MKIVYSYNKRGFEAEYWQKEIAAASDELTAWIPFNHDRYIDPNRYLRAQLLDNLYYERAPGLLRMYADLESTLERSGADALIVDNCFPYHPEFLLKLPVYKVLRTTDGPLAAYDRDFAYLHAYDHVLYHSPAYSRDLDMQEKLRYCGARRTDFWPLASFDALCDPRKSRADILGAERDIDVIFIGALHPNKMPLLAAVKRAFRRRMCFHGLTNLKRNLYFNVKFGFPGWVRPVRFEQYVSLYQRAKVGINVHNRGCYTVGGYRLFDLPANGVMQISDGGTYLDRFFTVGEEIESYDAVEDLIEKCHRYLTDRTERERIALNGFDRVQRDYKLRHLLARAAKLISDGMRDLNACGRQPIIQSHPGADPALKRG